MADFIEQTGITSAILPDNKILSKLALRVGNISRGGWAGGLRAPALRIVGGIRQSGGSGMWCGAGGREEEGQGVNPGLRGGWGHQRIDPDTRGEQPGDWKPGWWVGDRTIRLPISPYRCRARKAAPVEEGRNVIVRGARRLDWEERKAQLFEP